MFAATSSSMIYGLLPTYLIAVMGVGITAFGLIEGIAESANSLVKIVSGAASDRVGRRKPMVLFGYILSATIKFIFPLAGTASAIFVARVVDRMGKGIRDAPRDAFMADLAPAEVRGQGFGLRLALAVSGFVAGPLLAIGLMRWSGGDFRLVFWIALIPASLSIIMLLALVKELPIDRDECAERLALRLRDVSVLPLDFWWVIALAGSLSVARFSQGFILLKARDVGVDTIVAPAILTVTYLVFAAAAYPFGVLADRFDRRLQLGIGIIVLLAADLALARAGSIWLMLVGAVLWGLQLGITQGLLGAIIADIAPSRLRGTAFGIYDIATGVGVFIASAGVGALWASNGPAVAFAFSACAAAAVGILLIIGPYASLVRR